MSNILREALSDATGMLENILDAFSRGEGGVYKSDVAEVIANARAALAETPRNCDRPECLTYGDAIRTLEEECEDCDDPVKWLLAPCESRK